jgi:polysaccharide export outer membrane protein
VNHLSRKGCVTILGLLWVLGGCAASADATRASVASERDPRRTAFAIGPGDRIRVHVWKDEELSTEAFVRPDGSLTVPLVGEIRAAGLSAAELREEVRRRLDRYLKDPVVTIAVTEVNSYVFTVTGEVAHPGSFSSRNWVTVSEAVTLAGGPSRYADPSDVVVIRRDRPNTSPRRLRVDYEAILQGLAPDQDIYILPGDTVFVP